MIRNSILAAAAFGLCACATSPSAAQDTGITRIMVMAEDSDPDSVLRSSDIFHRVLLELQQKMLEYDYNVMDEYGVAARNGWVVEDRRSRTDSIAFAYRSCTDEDDITCPRLLVFVKIVAGREDLGFGTVAQVRLTGDIYDLAGNRMAATYQPVVEQFTAPRVCDAFCIEQVVGDHAYDIASALGEVLRLRLDGYLDVDAAPYRAGEPEADLRTEYVITFRGFTRDEIRLMRDVMEFEFPCDQQIGSTGGTPAAYRMNYSATCPSHKMESELYRLFDTMGLGQDDVYVTIREGREIVVEKITSGR